MRRRRLIIIGLIGLALVLLAAGWQSGDPTAPLPRLISWIQTGGSESEQEVSTIPRQTIADSGSISPIQARPISPISYDASRKVFLAYGLNDRTIYQIERSGAAKGLFRHDAESGFNFVSLSPRSEHLLVSLQSPNGLRLFTITTNASDRSEAPSGTTAASWMPDGRLIYARPQEGRLGIFITSGASFGDGKEIARVAISYADSLLISSPDGQFIAVVAAGDPFEEGIPAQIIDLAGKKIETVGNDVGSGVWSPDSRYFFGISGLESINLDDPVMIGWNRESRQVQNWSQAFWFPGQLYPYGGKYVALQTGFDGEAGQETWSALILEPGKNTARVANLLPQTAISLGLFAIDGDKVVGLGADTIYEAPVSSILNEAEKVAR